MENPIKMDDFWKHPYVINLLSNNLPPGCLCFSTFFKNSDTFACRARCTTLGADGTGGPWLKAPSLLKNQQLK